MTARAGPWPQHLHGPGVADAGNGSATFRVWAPARESMVLRLLAPGRGDVEMLRLGEGWFEVSTRTVAGERYVYVLDGDEVPDPASAWQPDGVHAPSAVARTEFAWSDESWRGLALGDYVVYELHVGTFTPEGTFDAAAAHLDGLAALGVNAVEIMPVAQFPGARNWGYDGVFPYAVQGTYGGPDGLKRLVDACHARGIAVVLDVVFNHLGPEGSVLHRFAPAAFTDRYRTPWGAAINFDGPGSDGVRRFFGGTARQWFEDFHVDALRLDAVHAIVDTSARPFLAELSEATDALSVALGRPLYLIAESDANDPKVTAPREHGGLGLHGQWNDDFQHAVHALVTGERDAYYAAYGDPEQVAKALSDGFVYDGGFSVARGHRFGAPAPGDFPSRFVVFSRNHDQVGNRQFGERLATRLGFEALKVVAACVLTAPGIPLLFMGEEYAEVAPFLYFVDHRDPGLLEAVRAGRAAEFGGFERGGQTPDPGAESTFLRSKLDHSLRAQGDHARMLALYARLLELRRTERALRPASARHVSAHADGAVIVCERRHPDARIVTVCSFETAPRNVALPKGRWDVLLDTADEMWGGPRRSPAAPVQGKLDVPPESAVVLRSATDGP